MVEVIEVKLLWIVILVTFLSLPLWAKTLPSPVNKQVVAEIVRTPYYGQQLFVDYDGGKPKERITWPRFGNDGQAISCTWSAKGLLLVQVDDLSANYRVGKGYKHVSSDDGSVGIFDPAKRVFYWIDGYYIQGNHDAANPQWQGESVVYTLTATSMVSDRDNYTKRKTVRITPQVLAKSTKDYAPKVAHFGNQLIEAVRQKGDLTPLLTKVTTKDRVKLKSYVERNRKRIVETFYVSYVGYKKPVYSLSLMGQPLRGEPSGGGDASVFGEVDLNYDTAKDVFRIERLDDPVKFK